MNLGVKITLDEVRPSVAKAIAGLNPQGIARLHRKIGRRLVILVRDHLLEYAQSHHKTADKLGAQPTGFWSTAVESVSMPTASQTDEHSARLELAGPGMARAFRDVDIRPGAGKTYLTIPLNATAYGNRYALSDDEHAIKSANANKPHRKPPPGATFVKTDARGGKWLFVQSVHQTQDRTILPSDGEIVALADKAASDYFQEMAAGVGDVIASKEGP